MALFTFAKTLSASMQTTIAGRYLSNFKPELKTKYRVFLPQVKVTDENGVEHMEVATLTVAGRSLVGKKLGDIYSYVFDSKEITVSDDGSYQDNTILRTLERTSNVLREAAYRAALEDATEKATKFAAEMGQPVDQTALAAQEEQLKADFFGSKDSYPKPENAPLIGRATKFTFTVGLFVPLAPDTGKPDFQQAAVMVWSPSYNKLSKVRALYKTDAFRDDYEAGLANKPYLEFTYDNTNGANKKEAGQKATYEYITDALCLEKKFPTEWKQFAPKLLEQLPKGDIEQISEAIVAKCGSLHNRATIEEIASKFYAQVAQMRTALIAIKKLDDDYLKKHKSVILQIPALNQMPPLKKFIEDIQTDEAAEAEAANAASTSVKEESAEEAASSAPEAAPAATLNIGGMSAAFGGLDQSAKSIDDDLGDI